MGTHPKPIERKQARALRKRGMPMKEIAGRLGVSPSSVSLWTRDIQLSPEQTERNLREAGRRRGVAWQELNRSRRLTYQLEGRERARQSEPQHQAGCMLYWAEGSKERNSVVFANSDVNMT